MSEKELSRDSQLPSEKTSLSPACCILVVDDSATNRAILTASFEDLGYEVREAENGEQALQRVDEGGINLIVLDEVMPGMSGQEVLIELRKTHSLHELPVIILTALYDPVKIVEAMKAGANDYINKPFEIEVMQARVSAHLSRKLAQEEIIRAKDEAEEASRAKSAYLSFMSHELRTPLNAIIGFCQLLELEVKENQHEQYLDSLNEIHQGGRRLLRLINDVLDLAKIEAGKLEVNVHAVTLSALIDSIVITMRPLIEQGGNAIEVDCADNVAEIRTDEMRLRQVLYNLLSNAAKFTENGKITIKADRTIIDDRETIRLIVQDNGVGIPKDKIVHLFRDFSQAHGERSSQNGTGLGLAISRHICKLLGGDVTVQSDEGAGATFTVLLPQ